MQKKINTPEGKYTAHESKVDSFPQKITRVSGDQLTRLRSLGADGPDFVRTYLPDFPEPKRPDLQDYDRAFRAWQLSNSPSHTNEEVIEILGGYLGNRCVDDLNMEWVTVSDQYGTDYAVRGKTAEVTAFPFSTVMKRVEDHEYDFLYPVFYSIKERLESDEVMERKSQPDGGGS